MNIVAYKNSLYSITQFLNMVSTNNDIKGSMFDINITSDGVIVIYEAQVSNNFNVKRIQASTYAQLQTEGMITLDSLLQSYRSISKKIYLNVLPILTSTLSEDTLEMITAKNIEYIEKIKSIIDKYKDIDISLLSTNQKILYHLQNHINNRHLGLFLDPTNLGFVDVDIYVFISDVYNESLVNEQLKNDKEVLLFVSDADDMAVINQYVKENNITRKVFSNFPKLSFLTDYPDLLSKIFIN